MQGYSGLDGLFHEDENCLYLHGEVRTMPQTKALKWDIAFCPECTTEMQAKLNQPLEEK